MFLWPPHITNHYFAIYLNVSLLAGRVWWGKVSVRPPLLSHLASVKEQAKYLVEGLPRALTRGGPSAGTPISELQLCLLPFFTLVTKTVSSLRNVHWAHHSGRRACSYVQDNAVEINTELLNSRTEIFS